MSAQPWGLCAERARDAVGRGWLRRWLAGADAGGAAGDSGRQLGRDIEVLLDI